MFALCICLACTCFGCYNTLPVSNVTSFQNDKMTLLSVGKMGFFCLCLALLSMKYTQSYAKCFTLIFMFVYAIIVICIEKRPLKNKHQQNRCSFPHLSSLCDLAYIFYLKEQLLVHKIKIIASCNRWLKPKKVSDIFYTIKFVKSH